MHESAGKGMRVAGFFVFQVGAGIILDSRAHDFGALVAICGAALLLWGLYQAGWRGPTAVTGGSPESSGPC